MALVKIGFRYFSKYSFKKPTINFKYRYLKENKDENFINIKPIKRNLKDKIITGPQAINNHRNNDYHKREVECNETNKKTITLENGTDKYLTSSDMLNIEYKWPKQQKRKKILNEKRRYLNLKLNKNNNEIIYGIHPVLLALKAKRRRFYNLYIKKDSLEKSEKIKEIYNICKENDINIYCVNKNELKQLAGPDSINQGVCLESSPLSFLSIDELKNNLYFEERKSSPKLLLYLNHIHDPMNLGAILRTAFFFGIEKVLTSSHDSCPITNVVSKASAGAAELLSVYSVQDDISFLSYLKNLDWQIVSSVSSLSDTYINIEDYQPKKSVLLIVGNEGKGISEDLLNLSDVCVSIQPDNQRLSFMETLNVSVATSVLMYSILSKFGRKNH